MTIYLQAIGMLAGLGGGMAILLLVANRFIANYGECSIKINEEEPFTIEGGRSLLDVLYERKIFIPSACGGQGTCGFCKIRAYYGAGPVLPTELPFLSVQEQDDNVRLACQVKIRQDLVIRVKEEYLNVKEYKAVVTKAEMKTADTREVHLKLIEPEEMEYRPGQYVQIFVPGTGETTFRAYSIASAPSSKKEIELLVRLIPGGVGSTYLHGVREGDEIALTGPYGDFVLDMSKETELVCVGGGCGMAPMRSILRHVAEVNPEQRGSLFFGARTDRDTMYFEDFQELAKSMPNFAVHYALSEPESSPEWDGETGFIHESVIRNVGSEGERQAFLCGPPPMVQATIKALTEKGMPRERVFYDEF